ncbi:hypothetical protein BDZ89DRAFT_1051067 [Hymenopellis radicata]|nr:hypothetical protein BDZ89DRAFT_1051067 [Hymenopellis radicata]
MTIIVTGALPRIRPIFAVKIAVDFTQPPTRITLVVPTDSLVERIIAITAAILVVVTFDRSLSNFVCHSAIRHLINLDSATMTLAFWLPMEDEWFICLVQQETPPFVAGVPGPRSRRLTVLVNPSLKVMSVDEFVRGWDRKYYPSERVIGMVKATPGKFVAGRLTATSTSTTGSVPYSLAILNGYPDLDLLTGSSLVETEILEIGVVNAEHPILRPPQYTVGAGLGGARGAPVRGKTNSQQRSYSFH